MKTTKSRVTTLAAILAGASLAITGCASGSSSPEQSSHSAHDTQQADGLQFSDMWVKAVPSGMTAAFGKIKNTGSETVHLVKVKSSVSPEMQLHETVQDSNGGMKMQEKKGGFEMKPGATLTLEPGKNHIMLMGVHNELKAGDEVDMTLEMSDGSKRDVKAVVKDFSGARENYGGSTDMPMSSTPMPTHSR